MAIPFLNNITLNNNEIQNVKLHNTANIPSPSSGHIYFDTDDNIAKYWNGSAWIDILSNTTYDISVGAGGANSSTINLNAGGSGSGTDSITIQGTDNGVKVTESGDIITVGLQADITVDGLTVNNNVLISGDLEVVGTVTTVNETVKVVENNTIEFEGTTDNEFEIKLTGGDPTADHTVSLPNASGTIALLDDINKTAIDALGIDASTLDGLDSADFLTINGTSPSKKLIGTIEIESETAPVFKWFNGDFNSYLSVYESGLTFTSDNNLNVISIDPISSGITAESYYAPSNNFSFIQKGYITKEVIDALGIDAGSLTGTLSDLRLTSNVALKDGNNIFTGDNTFLNGLEFTGNTIEIFGIGSNEIQFFDFDEIQFQVSSNINYVATSHNFTGNAKFNNGISLKSSQSASFGSISVNDTSVEIENGDGAIVTTPNKSGTIALLDDINDATLTVEGTNGLTGSGTFTANDADATTITISHADTSSQGSVDNSGRTYIQDITLDTYGHVTGITSATETVTDTQLATAAALIDVSAMGANTTASFTHSLASKNLIVQMYDVTTGEVVFADVDHTSINSISIIFAQTPTNDIRVVVIDAKNSVADSTVTYS